MLNSLFDTSTIPLLQKSAAFAERRQEVLAGNVANISTPDYRTRDLPVQQFQAALREAVARQTTADGPEQGRWSYARNPDKSGESFPKELFAALEGPPRTLTFQDGNNRSVEQEVMEMTKNSLLQSAAIELLNAQMSRLQAVISERA